VNSAARNIAVDRFVALVSVPEAAVDLGEAALALAAGADADLDPRRWLAELDHLAEGVADLDGLLERLFDEEGFSGDRRTYDDPANSLLHRVLERRRGMPITLAVVALEVARRAGIPLEGVGMPGHFLLRDPVTGSHLDPFDGGERLDLDQVEARFRSSTRALRAKFGTHLLPAAGPHAILARILANLHASYRARGRTSDVVWVVRMRLGLPGAGAPEVAALAEALASGGRFGEAAAELEQRLAVLPSGDAEALGLLARSFRARLN
jgi:regulator of sirC expression with transglutaminase-like and TPR domain